MKYVIFSVILFASFIVGTFGFAQIIGSLRTVRIRGIGMTLFTSVLWLAILGGCAALVLALIPQYQVLATGSRSLSCCSKGILSDMSKKEPKNSMH